MSDADTDTLLAIVASLLIVPLPDLSIILDVLIQYNGDPSKAANVLNTRSNLPSTSTPKPSSKRKRKEDLDDWLRPPTSKGNSKKPAKRVVVERETTPSPDLHGPVASSSTSSNTSKPAVNLMSVLRQPPTSTASKTPPRLPPLTLTNPAMVAEHVPCTVHLSVLPPDLACSLFHTMMHEASSWRRNKWWLFDRLVESPHRTGFYARTLESESPEDNAARARHWYNGRMMDSPKAFPLPMEEACDIVERVVNDELQKRTRFPLEWAGPGGEGLVWRANFAASNCYEGGKESVGWHSDQMTYLGPYCTIASLSLGTRRNFSLREVVPIQEKEIRNARTFNLPLPHNSLTIMHASCQERFKHSIPPQPTIDVYRPIHPADAEPSNCRINITFRFFRPDFPPSSIPKCKCGDPMILRPDMKNRSDGTTDRYWWACYSGAQNEGEGCGLWQVMDMKAEGRGPVIGDVY